MNIQTINYILGECDITQINIIKQFSDKERIEVSESEPNCRFLYKLGVLTAPCPFINLPPGQVYYYLTDDGREILRALNNSAIRSGSGVAQESGYLSHERIRVRKRVESFLQQNGWSVDPQSEAEFVSFHQTGKLSVDVNADEIVFLANVGDIYHLEMSSSAYYAVIGFLIETRQIAMTYKSVESQG